MFGYRIAHLGIVFFVVLIILLLTPGARAAGELDPSFNSAVYGIELGTVGVVKEQADGKILVGGYFSAANGTATSSLTRLNPDGSVDPSLTTQNIINAFGVGASLQSIVVQSDGKIVVGGTFFTASGVPQPGIRRLNTDGSLDTTFTPFIVFNGSVILDMEIQPDGKIIAGGVFAGAGLPENGVRLNTDGSIDPTFSSQSGITITDLVIQPDGKVVVVGHASNDQSTGLVRRLTATGVNDGTLPSSNINGRVLAVKLKANGQILIGGAFTSIDGFTLGRIALINSNGSLDLTFNQNNSGAGTLAASFIADIDEAPDGKWLIGGFFNTFNGVSRLCVARINPDGTLDTTFSDNTILINTMVHDVEQLASGRVLVGLSTGVYPVAVAVFNGDGSVDSGFSAILTLNGRVKEIAVQPDGKILIGGLFLHVNGVKRNGLARLNADGSLDTTFTPYFNNDVLPRSITALAVQSDGKIYIGIMSFNFAIRLNADGTRDTSFNPPTLSQCEDIIPLANGQVLIAGNFGVRRLSSTGSGDSSFGTPAIGVLKMLLQADGKILIGGTFTQIGTTVRGRIARLNSNGFLDSTFNPPGGANGPVEDFDVQADGKIVLGGDFTSLNGVGRLRLGRLFDNGSLDESFTQTADGVVRAIKIQPDGKILIGGSMGFVQSQLRVGVARLNPDGSLDGSFTGRPNTSVYEVVLQPDNKVLIGGEFILVNSASALRVARLQNAPAPIRTLFDYDGDSRADVSVFRPSENKWYIFRSSDSAIYQPIFAIAGDIPTPADFDGDGKTDVAIFRPSVGDWWYIASSDGSQRTTHWGAAGDIPRPSDFDGDGRADFIVFRPSENNWYRFGSTGAVSIVNFGSAGDKPLTGDYDGDGRSDPAIYRASTGVWWYRSSINGAFLAIPWGISTDIPAPADYDGDGKTDFAVYRASAGAWYIYNSGTGQQTVTGFGLAEDKPVPADFDGDGKADIAVFRPSTGIWYLLQSTAGFSAMQFGVSSDIPTENAFVP